MVFSNSTALRVILVGLVLLFSITTMWNSQLNHDTSWYLIATRWWIDGIPIYEQILELNPPMSFYVIAPPVFAAKILGTDPAFTVKIYVLLVATVSTVIGHRLMAADGRLTQTQLTIVTTSVLVGLVIVPFGTIAQREHFMLLFAWPYVVLMLVSNDVISGKTKVMIAIYSGFGLALKPHFLAIPMVLTLLRIGQTRKLVAVFSPQNWAILGFCCMYVVVAYVFHPAYFTEVIPKTFLVYDAYETDIAIVFGRSIRFLILLILLFLAVYVGPKTRLSAMIYGCGLAAFAAFLFYNIQSKGWTYHLLPFRFFLWVFATLAVIALYSDAKQKISAVVFGAITILMVLKPVLVRGPYSVRFTDGFIPFYTCEPGNRTFQVLGSNVPISFPMANKAGALPAVRAPTLWLFPGIIHRLSEDIATDERMMLHDVLDEYTKDIIGDLRDVKPQLLIIDDTDKKSHFHGAPFDYVAHFTKYDAFNEYWPEYTRVGRFSNFEIYRRQGC